MPSWSRFGAAARGNGGSVLPIRGDDDVDFKYHSKPSPPPPPRRRSGTQSLGRRRWLWLFLFANILALLVFIFSSVLYFPSVEPDNAVVRQALSQSEPDLRDGDDQQQQQHTSPASPVTVVETGEEATASQLVVDPAPPTTEDTALPRAEEGAKLVEPRDTQQLADNTDPNSTPGAGVQDLKQQSDPDTLVNGDSPTNDHVSISEDQLAATDVVTDTATDVAYDSPAMSGGDVEKTPISAEEPTTHAGAQPASRVAELIAKMKENALRSTSSPPADDALHERSEEPPMTVETRNKESREPADIDHRVEADTDAIQQNLVMWLKADEGVEVENLDQCRSTGAGTSCDVKAWTSQSAQDAFIPATSEQVRPTFIPSVSDLNGLPALYFSCPLVNKNLKLHEYMTLFFVLSPAQIETGATPSKAQKFFGNSPYGQFLFDGGKPGFLSNGGLRELSEAASAGTFYLLVYRLFSNGVELRMNRQQWQHGVAPAGGATADRVDDAFAVRMSNNAVLSLGNVKPLCDSDAFQGRIAEVLVFNTVLHDDRVTQVEQYLERKWWGDPLLYSEGRPDDTLVAPDSATERASESVKGEEASDPQETTGMKRSDLENVDREQQTAEDNNEGEQDHQATRAAQESHPTATATEQQEQHQQQQQEQQGEDAPPTFDPENVFEWTPPENVLARKQASAQQLAAEWARGVRESVESIRSFALGGDVLRSFIRTRKEELLALRQQLFG